MARLTTLLVVVLLSPSCAPPATSSVDVYFVVDTPAGLRLAAESRDVPARTAVEAAVSAMIEGPDDPDHATTWDPDTEVRGVRRAGAEVAVDLSGEARRANVGSDGAALMIQQLVHTVTSAAPGADHVRLLIDGEPAGELWGAVTWDGPLARDDSVVVR